MNMDLEPKEGRDPGLREVTDTSPLTVVIADDDVGTRIGAKRVLESAGFLVRADVADAANAIAIGLAYRPDICLIAAQVPGNGILAAEQIRQSVPETKIVILTVAEREEEMFAALRAGADGYLAKNISAARLPHVLRGVAGGEAALSRRLTARLIREFCTRGSHRRLQITVAGQSVELTSREFEILERMRRGEPTAKIAQHCRISEVTVRRHVSGIVQKLGVRDRRSALQLLKAG
jgi:two-component system, NarL family, nitrate/nitrite response regulator NarL